MFSQPPEVRDGQRKEFILQDVERIIVAGLEAEAPAERNLHNAGTVHSPEDN